MAHKTINGGFTLIEVLIATILIGMAIAALVGANGSFSMANDAGTDLSTAEFLVEQVRELTAMLAVVDPESTTTTFGPEEPNLAGYDDLDDLNGASFSPPINADRAALGEFPAFRQQVTVQNVNPSNLGQAVGNHLSQFVRVTVTVQQNGQDITTTSWIRAKY